MQTIITNHQRAILALWYVVNVSLSSYYKLVDYFGSPQEALLADVGAWHKLNIHKSHLERLNDRPSLVSFLTTIDKQCQMGLFNIVYDCDDNYPNALKDIFDPPPLLFYKGDVNLLQAPQIAIVGTRKPSEYAKKTTFDLANYVAQSGFVVTSGLAYGVDSLAHLGAIAFGKTIGVMGTGIDVVYPSAHRGLFDTIIQQGGCLISEFLPTTPASKHTFPRRNRLVTGLSVATIITEAAINSGSFISARLANEQGKQVFVIPGQIDNPNSEGCHYLIREGATLIYHPKQIFDELANPLTILPINFTSSYRFDDTWQNTTDNQNSNNQQSPNQHTTQNPKPVLATKTTAINLPIHLKQLYDILPTTPTDLDELIAISHFDAATLLGFLVELEILGVIYQAGGRYAKL